MAFICDKYEHIVKIFIYIEIIRWYYIDDNNYKIIKITIKTKDLRGSRNEYLKQTF